MVKVIGGFRQSGKTTKLIQLASRKGGFIVVENKMRANHLKRELQIDQKYNVSVITSDEVRRYKDQELYFDDYPLPTWAIAVTVNLDQHLLCPSETYLKLKRHYAFEGDSSFIEHNLARSLNSDQLREKKAELEAEALMLRDRQAQILADLAEVERRLSL